MWTNYVHAVVATWLGIEGTIEFVNENGWDSVWGWSSMLAHRVAWTCGYLLVDQSTSFMCGLHKTDAQYVLFHSGILVAFSLLLWNRSGALAALVGMVGELYTVLMHHHLLFESCLYDRYFQQITQLSAPVATNNMETTSGTSGSIGTTNTDSVCDGTVSRCTTPSGVIAWCYEHPWRLLSGHEHLVDLSFALSRWLPCVGVLAFTVSRVSELLASPILVTQLLMMIGLNVVNTHMFISDVQHYLHKE
jgi:hypothetical protein